MRLTAAQHNARQAEEARRRAAEIIAHVRAHVKANGRIVAVTTVMAEIGKSGTHFRDAWKRRPDLIQVETINRSVRARFAEGNGWSDWCGWSINPRGTGSFRERVVQGLERRKAKLAAIDPATRRKCLGRLSDACVGHFRGTKREFVCAECKATERWRAA